MGNATGQNVPEFGLPRWATFDCYGTLVDWNRGLGDELERLFGPDSREPALARYHQLEREIQARDPAAPYREVLAGALAGVAESLGRELPADERDALGARCRSGPSSRRSRLR